eukprot:s644_g3.t2
MILEWFPSGVNVKQLKDPGTTGNFEVTLDGRLIHSKKTQGQGFLEKAPKERQEEAWREVKAEIASAVGALGDTAQPSTGDFKAGAKTGQQGQNREGLWRTLLETLARLFGLVRAHLPKGWQHCAVDHSYQERPGVCAHRCAKPLGARDLPTARAEASSNQMSWSNTSDFDQSETHAGPWLWSQIPGGGESGESSTMCRRRMNLCTVGRVAQESAHSLTRQFPIAASARAFLLEMQEARVACNALHYNASIIACQRSSEWEHALDFFVEMQQRKLQQDPVSYKSIMSALCHGLSWQRALCLFSNMSRKRIQADSTCGSGIRACELRPGSEWTSALKLLQHMMDDESMAWRSRGSCWQEALNQAVVAVDDQQLKQEVELLHRVVRSLGYLPAPLPGPAPKTGAGAFTALEKRPQRYQMAVG